MSRQHRSISQQMAKARTVTGKSARAREWAESWGAEQTTLVAVLGKALARDDYDEMCQIVGQLKAVTDKRFPALINVISALETASRGDDD